MGLGARRLPVVTVPAPSRHGGVFFASCREKYSCQRDALSCNAYIPGLPQTAQPPIAQRIERLYRHGAAVGSTRRGKNIEDMGAGGKGRRRAPLKALPLSRRLPIPAPERSVRLTPAAAAPPAARHAFAGAVLL